MLNRNFQFMYLNYLSCIVFKFTNQFSAKIHVYPLIVFLMLSCVFLFLPVQSPAQYSAYPTLIPKHNLINAYLEYKEVVCSSIISFGIDMRGGNISFSRLPNECSSVLIPGCLPLGTTEDTYIPFGWDCTAKRLYVDYNRNRNLCDDDATFIDTRNGITQVFENVHLCLEKGGSTLFYCVSIELWSTNKGPECKLYVHSVFYATMEIDGKQWHIAVGDDLDGRIVPSDMASRDVFIIRPVHKNDVPFGACATAHLDILKIPVRLFLNTQGYCLDYDFETRIVPALLRVKFSKTDMQTGELKVPSIHLRSLILEGDTTVVIEKPDFSTQVPLGNYTVQRVSYRTDDPSKESWRIFNDFLKITNDSTANFLSCAVYNETKPYIVQPTPTPYYYKPLFKPPRNFYPRTIEEYLREQKGLSR